MATFRVALLLQGLALMVNSQTFGSDDYFSVPYYNVTDPPVSQECRDVLNTKLLGCSWTLQTITHFEPPVGYAHVPVVLEDICRPKCRQDLLDWRQRLTSGCKSTDVMRPSTIDYPAVYIPDSYLWVYDTSCYKSKTDGKFCYVVDEIGQLRNKTKIDVCSDCYLGVLAAELSSPVGYTDELAAQFSSATEKCSATGYSFTKTSYSDPTPTAGGSGGPASTSATQTSTGAPASTNPSNSKAPAQMAVSLTQALALAIGWIVL
ncbi:hypothetical protein QBC34DRAFT_76142 [Podospora aff. communis PSN243]|uniref:Uncharacterized protein n=1 Tax=Podospora aff. communis PSN243 TaxID=3040156 RepID=A0AAV9GVC9_9PEZI|nr:hypothetical protein QBC34DRAFT_76142 [Podospora aff. communis PSN243]